MEGLDGVNSLERDRARCRINTEEELTRPHFYHSSVHLRIPLPNSPNVVSHHEVQLRHHLNHRSHVGLRSRWTGRLGIMPNCV